MAAADLPKLPGMSFEPPRTDFRRRQAVARGVEAEPKRARPPPSVRVLAAQRGVEDRWTELTGRAFRFDAYFTEQDANDEREQRVRLVTLNHFLEDDAVQVVERRQENSGLPQGTIVRRQRIPADGSTVVTERTRTLTVQDYAIGGSVRVFGRTMHIVACDEYTRQGLRSLGVQLAPNTKAPSDPHAQRRAALAPGAGRKTRSKGPDKLSTFLANDKLVLRWDAEWDDRKNTFGDLRRVKILYYLADQTAEVREIPVANSGRIPNAKLVARQRISKKGVPAPAFTASADDPDTDEDYLSPEDIVIGETLTVYGRELLVLDADRATKDWLTKNLGVTEFNVVRRDEDEDVAAAKAKAKAAAAQSEGGVFGSDSANVDTLDPSRVRPSGRKLALEPIQLRFSAVLDTSNPIDQERRFVVTVYLSDSTIMVYEQGIRNSGIRGGKFLERQRLRRPDGTPYDERDIFVGARVTLNSYRFIITDADDFALRFMETHDDRFAFSDLDKVLDKVRDAVAGTGYWTGRELTAAFGETDANGCVANGAFRKALLAIVPGLVEQEVLTVLRRFDLDADGMVKVSDFVDTILPKPLA